MTELITMHTHSTFCGHAKDSLADMAKAAEHAGVAAMAATEHYPIGRLDPTCHASMPADRLDSYCDAVVAERAQHPDMPLLLGCELDWLGADEDRNLTPEQFERFDIVLGSVHFVDGWLINGRRQAARWETADIDAVWRRYIDLWCEAAASDAPFTVMSHPDVVKKFGHYPTFSLAPAYKRMAQAAAAGGRMIEVNTSGLYAPCAEMYPAVDLLREFERAGVACTVGTDAHEAGHVARGIETAYDIMRAAGYDALAVPGYGRTVRFIDL